MKKKVVRVFLVTLQLLLYKYMTQASSWKRKIAGLAAGLGIYAAVHDKPEAKTGDQKPIHVAQKLHQNENLEHLPPLLSDKERAEWEKYDRDYEASVQEKKWEKTWAAQDVEQTYTPSKEQKQVVEQKYGEIADILKNEKPGGLRLKEFLLGENLNEFCQSLNPSDTFFMRDENGTLLVQRFEGFNEDGKPKITGKMEVQIEPQEDGTNEYNFRSAQRFGENNAPLYEEIITNPNPDDVSKGISRYYGFAEELEKDGKVQYESDIDINKPDDEIVHDLAHNVAVINGFLIKADDAQMPLNPEARNELNQRRNDYQEQLDDMNKQKIEEEIDEIE